MGSSMSKPEFVTVLADKQVRTGDKVTLRCQTNTETFKVTWTKNGKKLIYIEGKHTMKQTYDSVVLEVSDADEGDEGMYTVTLSNKKGSESCSAVVTVGLREWRTLKWDQEEMMHTVKNFKARSDKVQALHFLLYGPVGAGKSSVINTIESIFNGRPIMNCLTSSETDPSSISKTLNYEKCQVATASLPLAFSDTMGVDLKEKRGVLSDDIISALTGHMKNDYTFHPVAPLTEHSLYYHQNPSLSDKTHCLVYVIPADKISLMKGDFIKTMTPVKREAEAQRIPQVIFMTRVDLACPMTKKNLRNVYKSKKIKDKIYECSHELGVPVNCIFPLQNYHKEIDLNKHINCLMLNAVTRIAHIADDYVVKCSNKQPFLYG